MKKTVSNPLAPGAAPEAGVDVDRSREVMETLAREPRDQLTCTRVFDDYYRCNWWAPGIPAGRAESLFEGLEVSTFRVRKSQFVRAALRDGQLIVEDASRDSSR